MCQVVCEYRGRRPIASIRTYQGEVSTSFFSSFFCVLKPGGGGGVASARESCVTGIGCPGDTADGQFM